MTKLELVDSVIGSDATYCWPPCFSPYQSLATTAATTTLLLKFQKVLVLPASATTYVLPAHAII